MTPVRLEPTAPWSRVKHSTTEPLRSPFKAFECFLSTFQGKSNFHGLFKTVLYIQVLFKPVRTPGSMVCLHVSGDMGLNARKPIFRGLRTKKVQTNFVIPLLKLHVYATIKFTSNISHTLVNFLNIKVTEDPDRRLITAPYYTNRHPLLPTCQLRPPETT